MEHGIQKNPEKHPHGIQHQVPRQAAHRALGTGLHQTLLDRKPGCLRQQSPLGGGVTEKWGEGGVFPTLLCVWNQMGYVGCIHLVKIHC